MRDRIKELKDLKQQWENEKDLSKYAEYSMKAMQISLVFTDTLANVKDALKGATDKEIRKTVEKYIELQIKYKELEYEKRT